MATIFHNRELRYERDMLGAIQGVEARPEVGIPLVGRQRDQDAKPGQGLENAMQGLILSQQPSLLPSSVLAHNLPCLDSLANQVSHMEMSEEMEVGSNGGMNPGGQQQQQEQVATQEEMEAPSNPAYRQYLADRAEEERREMMPTSMMAHCILPTNQHQQHQMLLYQQLGMVQQQQQLEHQHRQVGSHQLAQQLGGSSLISTQPDLVPVLSSLHLV